MKRLVMKTMRVFLLVATAAVGQSPDVTPPLAPPALEPAATEPPAEWVPELPTPSNIVPWSTPEATLVPDEPLPTPQPTCPDLSDASREEVENFFHHGAEHYIHSRDQQAGQQLIAGLLIDPCHEPSRKLLEKIAKRQQQKQQQQQQDQQDQQQGQGENQEAASTPTPSDQSQDRPQGDQATPTPSDEQQREQAEHEEREMSPEEAQALLDQLAREEAQRRREEVERRRSTDIRVEKDW